MPRHASWLFIGLFLCGTPLTSSLSWGQDIDAILIDLQDSDQEVRLKAVEDLGEIGADDERVVPALIAALDDWSGTVRGAAAEGLVEVGGADERVVPALVSSLGDESPWVRRSAEEGLIKIGVTDDRVVPSLIDALSHKSNLVRETATSSLGEIGLADERVVPTLVAALDDGYVDVRQEAIRGLARFGMVDERVVPALITVLDDAAGWLAIDAITTIALDAQAEERFDLIDVLARAQGAIEGLPSQTSKQTEAVKRVRTAIEALEQTRALKFWYAIGGWATHHPWIAASIVAVTLWLPAWLVIFLVFPLRFFAVARFLKKAQIPAPISQVSAIELPAHWLILGWLWTSPRVLDAWVSRHSPMAMRSFASKKTVEERTVHIPLPVELKIGPANPEVLLELSGERLRPIFEDGNGRVLIWGEGGAGKTSIACQIATWAMDDKPEQRLAGHRTIPVLLERELDFEVAEGSDPFIETLRGDLAKLIGEEVPGDVFEALLQRRRILVIVDHMSEMTEQTRQQVRPDRPGIPANMALVVTSRREEGLGDVPKSVLRPQLVTGDYLFEFMGAYLRAKGVRDRFLDQEFADACGQIASLVGTRATTVLLVKLFADQLIRAKKAAGDLPKGIPGNIPDLMLHYVNNINATLAEEERREARVVQLDAEAVAWACLKETYRPAAPQVEEEVIPALARIEAETERARLDYLDNRLGLIEMVEPGFDQVRYRLDPLAEYLAGLNVIRQFGSDEKEWRTFLTEADKKEGAPEAITGFLLAVRDCCLAYGQVPDFVVAELEQRAGLDPEVIKKARLAQRVSRLISDLSPYRELADRGFAAEALGNICTADERVVPALIMALEDEHKSVRWSAAIGLGKIGEADERVVPALIKALEDKDEHVRRHATEGLCQIGVADEKVVPALIKALGDGNMSVTRLAAKVLAKIGVADERIVPALLKAAFNPKSAFAARSLGKIGVADERVVPTLLKALNHEHTDVCRLAAEGLGEIGVADERVVPALTKAAIDHEDVGVRRRAAKVLIEFGVVDAPAPTQP